MRSRKLTNFGDVRWELFVKFSDWMKIGVSKIVEFESCADHASCSWRVEHEALARGAYAERGVLSAGMLAAASGVVAGSLRSGVSVAIATPADRAIMAVWLYF